MPRTSSEQIIREIEKRKVVPIPRWHFILRRSVFWVLALISVITGAISMATAIYVFIDNDYVTDQVNIEKFFEQRPLIEVIIQSIPYVWLVALGLFILAAYYGVRHTRKGYRYPMTRVIAGSLLLSLLLCGILNVFDIGKYIHRYLIENVRGYDRLVNTNEILWTRMDKGLLGGKVVRFSMQDSTIVIQDYKRRRWNVNISGAQIHLHKPIAEGRYLKITGVKTAPDSFKATTIRPWVRRIHRQNPKAEKLPQIKDMTNKLNTLPAAPPGQQQK
jgi:heme/copper-type cytochrome/quinol oxidase subunit 2